MDLVIKEDCAQVLAFHRAVKRVLGFKGGTGYYEDDRTLVEAALITYKQREGLDGFRGPNDSREKSDAFDETIEDAEYIFGEHIPYHGAFADAFCERVEDTGVNEIEQLLQNELDNMSRTMDFFTMTMSLEDYHYLSDILKDKLCELEVNDLYINSDILNRFKAAISKLQVFIQQYASQAQSRPKTHAFIKDEKDASAAGLAQKPKLSLRQVALFYIYEGMPIARSSMKAIALKYNHNSGDRLYNLYKKFVEPQNRLAVGEIKQARPLIRDIECVIGQLSEKARNQAQRELKTIRDRIY